MSIHSALKTEEEVPLTQVGRVITEQRLEIDRLESELARKELDLADVLRSAQYERDNAARWRHDRDAAQLQVSDALEVIAVLRDMLIDRGAIPCRTCERTGGRPIVAEYTPRSAWSPSDPEPTGEYADMLDEPCDDCDGLGVSR